ncbi:MAG: DNA-3-methyladenine glycosylase family protein, partial [Allosphingosinicella sp.]
MNSEQLKTSLDALAVIEPAFGQTLARIGYPGPRERERGHQTLVQAIISQQVSVKAAAAILARVEAATGGVRDPENVARTSDEALRAAGLSRQKIAYLRSLSEDVLSGRLDFQALPDDDEEAIAALVHVKGI